MLSKSAHALAINALRLHVRALAEGKSEAECKEVENHLMEVCAHLGESAYVNEVRAPLTVVLSAPRTFLMTYEGRIGEAYNGIQCVVDLTSTASIAAGIQWLDAHSTGSDFLLFDPTFGHLQLLTVRTLCDMLVKS